MKSNLMLNPAAPRPPLIPHHASRSPPPGRAARRLGAGDGRAPICPPAQAVHHVARKEDGLFLRLVQHGLLVDELEDAHVGGVERRGVGVPEDGDELVPEDVALDRGERRARAAL